VINWNNTINSYLKQLKVKIKPPVFLIKHRTEKTHGSSGIISLRIRQELAALLSGKSPLDPLDKKLGGYQFQSGH
jgi:hypothetical protein